MTRPPRNLAAAVFRALYQDYELRAHGALYVVTAKGTPVYISPSPGRIARHLSAPRPDPALAGAPPPARRPSPG